MWACRAGDLRFRRSLSLFQRAQELAGGNLSRRDSNALRRYVDVQEGLREGFDEITVRVGLGSGRKVRFTGVLVGEWSDTSESRAVAYRVFAGGPASTSSTWNAAPVVGGQCPGQAGGLAGLGGPRRPALRQRARESTLDVIETLDGLRNKVPPELFESHRTSRQPAVEELDI